MSIKYIKESKSWEADVLNICDYPDVSKVTMITQSMPKNKVEAYISYDGLIGIVNVQSKNIFINPLHKNKIVLYYNMGVGRVPNRVYLKYYSVDEALDMINKIINP